MPAVQMVTWSDDTGVEAHTVFVDQQLPMALARLHWDMPVGSSLTVEVSRDDSEGKHVDRLRDLAVGAGFAVDDVVVEGRSIRMPAHRERTRPTVEAACVCWCAA